MNPVIANCSYGVGSGLLDVTFSYDLDVLTWWALSWSFIAHANSALCGFGYAATGRISFIMGLWIGAFGSAFNEFALAHIHPEGRPPRSCLTGLAMPSGHAFNTFAMFSFILFEAIFRSYWGLKRKILVIIAALVFLAPAGPARYVVGDHSEQQVGFGMLSGLIWSIIWWIFTRYVFARFMNEPMQCNKVVRFFLRNDYDPEFRWSHWKGKKFEKATPISPPITRDADNEWPKIKIFIFQLIYVIINVLLGVLGIVLGVVKHERDPNCHIIAPFALITVGGLTLFNTLILIEMIVLVWFRFRKDQHSWIPYILHYTHYFWAFVTMLTAFWSIGGYATVDAAPPCQSNLPQIRSVDLTVFYFSLWLAIQAFLYFAYLIFGYLWNFLTLFGLPKEDVAVGSTTTKNVQAR